MEVGFTLREAVHLVWSKVHLVHGVRLGVDLRVVLRVLRVVVHWRVVVHGGVVVHWGVVVHRGVVVQSVRRQKGSLLGQVWGKVRFLLETRVLRKGSSHLWQVLGAALLAGVRQELGVSMSLRVESMGEDLVLVVPLIVEIMLDIWLVLMMKLCVRGALLQVRQKRVLWVSMELWVNLRVDRGVWRQGTG